jgi:Bifunctional DNA primase/polymerase, N-terminal/Primase C terminal 1 (PriCT-1)
VRNAGWLFLAEDISMNSLHTAALELAEKGLAVFPCQPRGKAPACDAGLHAATTDPERINRWWQSFPDLNIGIATGAASRVFVLDIDGDDGEASLRKLEGEHSALPPTIEVITGKGRHCYFQFGKHKIGNSAGQLGTGLDIRGNGGYVIAPPSIHPSGRSYAWSVDAAQDFAAAPDWLITKIEAPKANSKVGKPLEHWHSVLTEPIRNGQRNTTLASIAGKLIHSGLHDVTLIYDLVMCVNIARCEQQLPADEVETIVISVMQRHLRGRQT